MMISVAGFGRLNPRYIVVPVFQLGYFCVLMFSLIFLAWNVLVEMLHIVQVHPQLECGNLAKFKSCCVCEFDPN